MNEENILVNAIQNQQMVEITFHKETSKDYVVREVAPYDIFDKNDKNGYSRRSLLGYCWEHEGYKENPIYIYLDTIIKIDPLSKRFNGVEVKDLINPKRPPEISRNW